MCIRDRYPSVEAIKEFLAKDDSKPFICCEYTHAMGNSCGAMHKYTDLTDTEPKYQGGFIWDYIDQSIYKKDRYGKAVSYTHLMNGKEVKLNTVQEAIDNKLAYVTEDRKGNGLILSKSIKMNTSLANMKGCLLYTSRCV